MAAIVWEVPWDVAERIYYMQQQVENYELTREEFRDALTGLPGYPLTRPLTSGDNLVVRIKMKATTHGKKVIIQ